MDHIYLYTFLLKVMFVTKKISFFGCIKDAVGADQQKYRLRLSPISGGFRRLRSAAYRAMRVIAAYTIVTLHNIPKLLIKCAAVGEKR